MVGFGAHVRNELSGAEAAGRRGRSVDGVWCRSRREAGSQSTCYWWILGLHQEENMSLEQ